jgi:hypothetical protein
MFVPMTERVIDRLRHIVRSMSSRQAADMAIKATEVFFNQLRSEIGNKNFDRLFAIHPTSKQCQIASSAVAEGERYRFFSPYLSASLKSDRSLLRTIKHFFRQVSYYVRTVFDNGLLGNIDINEPTYDLTDQGFDVKDIRDFRSASNGSNQTSMRR